MVNDQVADFLTRVRNAGKARLSKTDVLNSKMNRAVAKVLVDQGYLKGVKEISEGKKTVLRVYLRFEGGDLKKPVIQKLIRVSRPGLRKYVKATQMPKVMSGFGLAILSTSKGLLTDKDALKIGVGGEHICSVW